MNNRSFTLIELLIASSIFIIIMVTLYLSFNTGLFGYKRIEDALFSSSTALRALGRINLDLRNSFAYSDNETKFQGNENEISFLTLLDAFRDDKITQDYAFISYNLEGNKLLRLCRRNQDSLNEKADMKSQILASDIEKIIFSYGHYDSGKHTLEWEDKWNETAGLPAAVKIILTVKKNETGCDFERMIYLVLGGT